MTRAKAKAKEHRRARRGPATRKAKPKARHRKAKAKTRPRATARPRVRAREGQAESWPSFNEHMGSSRHGARRQMTWQRRVNPSTSASNRRPHARGPFEERCHRRRRRRQLFVQRCLHLVTCGMSAKQSACVFKCERGGPGRYILDSSSREARIPKPG